MACSMHASLVALLCKPHHSVTSALLPAWHTPHLPIDSGRDNHRHYLLTISNLRRQNTTPLHAWHTPAPGYTLACFPAICCSHATAIPTIWQQISRHQHKINKIMQSMWQLRAMQDMHIAALPTQTSQHQARCQSVNRSQHGRTSLICQSRSQTRHMA